MEFGQYQLQIFSSLIVMLGAAFVALICDFLKGTNEQLRELAIELRVRRQEEVRWAAKPDPAVSRSMIETPAKEAQAPAIVKSPIEIQKKTMEADANKRGALPEKTMVKLTPFSGALSKNMSNLNMSNLNLNNFRKIPVKPRTAPQVPKKDWGAILHPSPSDVPVSPEAAPPVSLQNGSLLPRLVENRRKVSGLVASIGVHGRASSNQLPADFNDLLHSLTGPEDLVEQKAPDEFVLILPNERGAAAQRRLNLIAEQLWDFQLRSLTSSESLSVQLTLGGLEVRDEPIEEAISAASERMHETQRSRKLMSSIDAPARSAV